MHFCWTSNSLSNPSSKPKQMERILWRDTSHFPCTTRFLSRITLHWLLVTPPDNTSASPAPRPPSHARKQVSHVTSLLRSRTAASGTFYFCTFFLLTYAPSRNKERRRSWNGNQLCLLRSRPGSTPRASRTFLTRLRQFHRNTFRYLQDRFHWITGK